MNITQRKLEKSKLSPALITNDIIFGASLAYEF